MSKKDIINIYIPSRKMMFTVMDIMEKEMKKGSDILDASIPAAFYLIEKTKLNAQERFTTMSTVMHLFEISKMASKMILSKKNT